MKKIFFFLMALFCGATMFAVSGESFAIHTTSAFSATNTYTITTNCGANGYISPENPEVEHGAHQTFTFFPDEGYKVEQVLIDGIVNPIATLAGIYTFQNVTTPHTVEVSFTKIIFTITTTYTIGGTITPLAATVEYGADSEIFVFDVDNGYHIQGVLIDGVNNALAVENGMHRFLNVTDNHTIHIVFALNNFAIMATASEGGIINPNGIVTVPNGGNQLFYFAPNTGYYLVRVLVDGISDSASVNSGIYLFKDVSAHSTIVAHFEKKTYNVSFQSIPGTFVTPVDESTSPVEYGGNYKFTVDLEENYTQSNIIVRANGVVVIPTENVYTINNISIDQIITISGVNLNKYEIIAQAFAGGVINPAGIFAVDHGDSKTFEITSNTGYKINDVVVNGESIGVVESYTFNNIETNHSIKVYFSMGQGIDENDVTINVFTHNNVVTIVNEQLVPIKQIEIIDMYGRLVWTGQALTKKTDITLDVAAGIYGVRIITELNGITTTNVSIIK